jgi:tRNA-uridine 2-sulfurtransferase
VGPKEALARHDIHLREMNWLESDAPPEGGREVLVKLRSAHVPIMAMVYGLPNGRAHVVFHEPQYGVAPGQACVMYEKDRVLGGGWISAR